jgi:transposase
MIKRHEVQVLLAAGHSHSRVAIETGVAERTVDRIAKEPSVAGLDDLGISAARRIGRPSTVAEREEEVNGWLEEKPDLPTVEVLHRLRMAGYEGGKTAVYELVRALRGPAPSRVMVRFEGLPGEFAQFDFGSVDVAYLSGESEKIRFAAYRLKYSRWVYVEIVPNEQVEALSRALIRGFEGSGGVPLSVVFDNPKTVVIHPKQTPIVWSPTTAQLAVDFAFAIELCAPRRGEQKGSVENLVGWVKGSFFKVRRFQDRQDLEGQLQEWLTEANDERPCRATGEIPAVRLARELPRLRPLVVAPEDYGLRFDVFVGPTGMVDFKGIRYAMPAETVGFNGTLYLYPDRVRIIAGRFKETHARFPDRNLSYPHGLRTQHLAKVSGERGRLYFQRQRLLELGPPAEHSLTELIHQRPRVWKGDVEKLFTLLGQCGDEPLMKALQIALMQGLIGAEYVADLVRKEVSA